MKIKRSILFLLATLLFFSALFYAFKGNILTLLFKPYLEQTLSKSFGIKVDVQRIDFSWIQGLFGKFALQSPFGPLTFKASLPLVRGMRFQQVKIFINNIPFVLQKNQDSFRIYSDRVELDKLLNLPFKVSGKGGVTWTPSEISAQFDFKDPLQPTEGKLVASFKLKKGTVVGSGLFSLKDFFIKKEKFASISLPFTLSPNEIHFPGIDLQKKKGHLYIQGSIFKKKSLNFKIHSKNLALEEFDFFPSFHRRPLKIELKGSLTGTLSTDRLSESVISTHFSDIRLGTHTSLRLEGGLSREGNLNLIVEGDLNNELLTLIIPSIEKSSGKAKVSFRAGGRLKNPVFFGNYFLSDGLLKTSWFPHTLEQLNANITFSKNKISLHKLEGELGGGKIDISGDILLKPSQRPQLDIRTLISDAQIQYPKWISSRISGALYLKGIEKPYEISGNLMVSEALYKENIDWEAEILNFKRKPYLPKTRVTEKPPLKFNVSIRAAKNIFIKNNLADLEAGADFLLRGNSYLLIPIGKMELISGTAFFKENTFTLNSGKIIFDNPVEIDPKFSIFSETTIQEYKISLGIEGTLSNYTVRLSSQPTLPESDIVSLLTFGALRSEIEKQESLEVTSLELGSLFFGKAQKAVESAARKALGLKFRLSPSYSDTKHATVPRLLVGKTVTKNIDAAFSSTFDKSSVFSEKEFNLKYNLHRNLSLLGFLEDPSEEEVQDNASFGVDFKVQFEFK